MAIEVTMPQMGADMTELVRTIATSLAEKPDAIEVSSFSKGRTNYVRLKVDPEDMVTREF